MIQLHPLEILPIIIYLIFLLFIGFRKRIRSQSEDDFIVGGRQLTLPAFVATLVTTWYGGILGVGEFTYLYGLSTWVVFGLPYYVFAIIFALFFAGRIQRAKLLSIPDQFYSNYGFVNGIIGTVYTLFMTIPAPYVLMVGFLIQIISGWSLWICILAGTLFSFVYVFSGGFHSVVRTDKLQFLLMFIGFFLMLFYLVRDYGGLTFLSTKLPDFHLTWHGGNSPQYIVVWFFIALWTLIDPGFHQRCYAAKSAGTAKKGIFTSIFFWLIFDFLTTATGLYARALLPEAEPVLSYPLLSHKILSPLFSGLFLTGILATIMSTLDSGFLLSAVTIGHDLLAKFRKISLNKTILTQIGIFISALISILFALAFPSVIQIWYLIGSVFVPPMLLPVIGSYYEFFRIQAFYTSLNLIVPVLFTLYFIYRTILISPSVTELNYWMNIQPMYPGLFVSLIIFFIAKIAGRKTNSE